MDLPDKSVPATPAKNISPVVKGAQVERSAGKRFKDFLFAESPKALSIKIGKELVVPRLKASAEEAINGFISGMLWGDGSTRPMSNIVKGTVLRGNNVPYSQISVNGNNSSLLQARMASENTRSSGNYKDVVTGTQQQAELLLANMYQLLNQYRVVAVADLYELAEISPSLSDNAFGWTSLDGARISKVREGYALELPQPHII